MAIISESKRPATRLYASNQFRYSIIYVLVTSVVLLFLNIYCSSTSQKLFYQSKEVSMLEKCSLAATEIGQLEVMNAEVVAEAVRDMESLRITRLVVTDRQGRALYDSVTSGATNQLMLLPEVVTAMQGKDVFTWRYHDGAMHSQVAIPVYSYGSLVGCVYMMEYDTAQGALIQSLQQNVFRITLILELAVILFSVIFSNTFSRRLRRIMASMRIIREGDYAHKVSIRGSDELAFLGGEVNDLTDRLQASEDQRRQFVSDASHELKTPLASIKLLSDSILQNDMDMATVREFVTDIGNEADRLNRMSQKLLSLSRVESQSDGDCEIVNMAPTVERVVRMLSGIAAKNSITIHTDLQQDSPILILEDDLYQITFNLVENGIKYNTPEGQLFVTLLRDGENAVLKVRDTGVGIPEESLPQIFERFYRVDKARSRKSGGSGLGLSIVRNMVERNEGTICVESRVGEGTVFTVTFPVFDVEEEEL